MKGLFEWFNSKAKIKRWIFLILIGIVLICYGISNVLVSETLEIIQMVEIIVTFVIGFAIIVLSIIHVQKRTLELLVEESDTRKEKNNVKSLIFNKKVYNQGPKIVVIGGGTGLNSVLRGLKNYTDNITAIVTVSDYGKTPTDSRRALQVLPLNDVKDSLAALAYNENEMSKLLNYKFDDGRLDNLSFGDIYFLAMNKLSENFSKSIEESGKVLSMTGKVLPVTLEEIKICAELEDGTVIENKDKIPEIVGGTTKKISRIFIRPTNCKPGPGVIEAIREADAIIIGPGSLYTNVIPNLLVNGIAREIKLSKAMKVYVSNIMTEFGQTDDYTLSEHIKAIQDYLGQGIVEYCIYDTGEIIPEYIHKYNVEGSDIVLPDTQKAKSLGVKLIQRNLSKIEDGVIRHDSDIIASTIIQLVCDELEFADMENDSQYMTLNSKLTETKREMKKRERAEKKFNKSGKKKFERKDPQLKSKFNSKYKDRIQSIKESKKNTPEEVKEKKESKLFDFNKEENSILEKKIIEGQSSIFKQEQIKEQSSLFDKEPKKEESLIFKKEEKERSSIFRKDPKKERNSIFEKEPIKEESINIEQETVKEPIEEEPAKPVSKLFGNDTIKEQEEFYKTDFVSTNTDIEDESGYEEDNIISTGSKDKTEAEKTSISDLIKDYDKEKTIEDYIKESEETKKDINNNENK